MSLQLEVKIIQNVTRSFFKKLCALDVEIV